MRRTLTTVFSVGAISLLFSGICAGATLAAGDENPAAPVSGTTGGAVSSTPEVVRLIADGMANSPTFAEIVARLLESNVLATIEPDLQIKCGLSGYMVFITHTPFRRYLRIYFDPRMQRWQQIAVIGHELWHALEVANHPDVVDQATLRMLYASIGHGYGDKWDSDAAIATGHTIGHELSTTNAADDHR